VDQGRTRLNARPYVVTPQANLVDPGRSWAERRHVTRLGECLRAVLCEEEDGRRRLPGSLLHDLREGLFLGSAAADARLRLALGRHRREHFGPLLADGPDGRSSLFVPDAEQRSIAYLLDAMDLAGFWNPEDA
jgi:hypothetical protein